MLNKKCYKYVKYVKYLKYMSNIVQHSTTFAPPLETLHAPPGGRAPQFKNPWFSVSKNNCFYFKTRNIWRQSSWREIVFIK